MKKQDLKELWGEELFNAFADHIDNEGWLTEKSNLYTRMYIQDFEKKETDLGVFIKPI